ncbi:branched-chain amino acid aminotransferase [Haliangium ochraceum]|uniref:Branched-chain-amino-acid aminotransferase n=1 Tax=Haliangium ochraceum (strain DSM 14365 / JCM 11303 / SMP-2) TaxID=502025 RepID=D0LRL2_HALO1|nr:branched-chain amino acid aminotransferase [Haliangium ochraceum]ACY19004.1 branched-chain amino acid aminotransferase [Haliangium ochraceum DSM 14365]
MRLENHYLAQADLEFLPSDKVRSADDRARAMKDAGFGRVFTDHMVVIQYTEEEGWHRGRLQAFQPLSLHPATAGVQYAQTIFEGFKAYRQPDGRICSFRPDSNAERFNQSAERMAMPQLPSERFVRAIDALIWQDREWVPDDGESSLYVRPFMLGTDPFLGVRPSRSYLFCAIAGPASSYFATGVKPVAVWVTEDHVRAAPGGTGAAKCAGNYAASLLVQKRAAEHECQQVVWLDAVEHRYIEEMGGMNMFFVRKDGDGIELITPELTGTILPGITRNSILELAQTLGYRATERKITVDEWRASTMEGLLTEAFACGTAATVTPIGRVETGKGSFTINGGEMGPVTQTVRQHLLDIQFGRVSDPHEWMHPIV